MIREKNLHQYVLIINIFFILFVSAQKQNSYNYQYGNSYGSADSRYFRHGDKNNEMVGGTCSQFIQLNSLSQCCAQRDDDCYMIHYDTRCYCDVFCDRSKIPDNSDCCPDAGSVCSGDTLEHVATTKVHIFEKGCQKNGIHVSHGTRFLDNCNEW